MPEPLPYRIEPGQAGHIPGLGAIELAAARVFSPGSVPEFLYHEITPPQYFTEALATGDFWVALHGEEPVGYALLRLIPDPNGPLALLAQIDVRPEHARRGLGRRLEHFNFEMLWRMRKQTPAAKP